MPVLSVSGKVITRTKAHEVTTEKQRKHYRKAKKSPQITDKQAKRMVDEKIGRMIASWF